MSFVSGLLSGGSGAGFQAKSADTVNVATADQANQQYANAQQGLSQQQSFVNALQGQNGIQNQSSVYGQMQNIANGQGANPALAQLNQTTAQNTQNQAALMAGQRGAGANTGLMARQAAQQGAATQQQAAGQAATMKANQQMQALQGMGQMANSQVSNQANALNSYNSAAQGEQGQILGAINNQNQNAVQMQSNENSANASVAAANAKSQSGMLGGALGGLGSMAMGVMSGGATSALGMARGGVVKNYDDGGTVSSAPSTPAPGSGGPKSKVGGILKQALGSGSSSEDPLVSGMSKAGTAIGTGLGKLFGGSSGNDSAPAKGNTADDYNNIKDYGNNAQDYNNLPDSPQAAQNSEIAATPVDSSAPAVDSAPMPQSGDMMTAHKGGKIVPTMLSPGEKYLSPNEAEKVAAGRASVKDVGTRIPGKAKVKGDSLKNDVVPFKAQEGGIVIPRTHMKDMSSAMKFVHAHMRENGLYAGAKKKAK